MALFHTTLQAAGAVTAAVANRVDLGDITLPAGNWTITRAWAHGTLAGAVTAVEGLMGYIQLESVDCGIAPFQFFIEPINGPLGTGDYGPQATPRKNIVNCPAAGGSVINVYHVCDQTISTTVSEILVTLEFSNNSPFGGGQIHMKCGEPAGAGSTTDGGVTSLTDIEIKASTIHAVITYAALVTPTTATGVILQFEMKSDDFGENGVHKWGLNTIRAGAATNSTAQGTETQLQEVGVNFRSGGAKQTVSAELTSYDAIAVAPVVNWCLVYS